MTNKNLGTEAVIQIGSGGIAGFVEVLIMHPLDLIKTRLQLQSTMFVDKKDERYYSGIVDCTRKMYINEGLTSFWKGILPPLLVESFRTAVKFFTFEQYQQFFLFGSPKPTPLTFALAGFGSGATEAFLINPFEVVKVTLQANRQRGVEVPSTWYVTKDIFKRKGMGLQGLNKGLTATIARNAVYNMIYFGFYYSVKELVPEYKEEPLRDFFRKLGIGITSGVLGSCVNIPFDVAKSRIQGPQPVLGEVKYRSTFKTVFMVSRDEGVRALYKGLLPKVLRLGPGGAIMLLVYEYLHDYLTANFM